MKPLDNLIIGSSAAAVGAVESLRNASGPTRSIGIVSEEDMPPYAKPFIGDFVSGKRTLHRMWYRPPSFYEENSVEFLGGRRAEALNLDSRRIVLENGEVIRFRKLLFATGGSPIVPPIPGLSECAHTFATILDAKRIKQRLDEDGVSSAVVLGGGLIGAAATAALVERGIRVSIVELAPRILSSVLDEEASAMVQGALEERGVRIITGHTLSEVKGDEEHPDAVMDSGEEIPSDLLIVAIGVRPRVDLARNTAIEIDRGIVVNKKMETNVPGVYAAGDCTQMFDCLRETQRVLALWPTAYIGGMVAGYNMSGRSVEMDWATTMNSMHFLDMAVMSAGIVVPEEGDGWRVMALRGDGEYRKIVTRNGVIKGFVLIGSVDNAGLYLQLMRSKMPVAKLGESLLSPDFDMAQLPPMQRKKLWKEAGKVVAP